MMVSKRKKEYMKLEAWRKVEKVIYTAGFATAERSASEGDMLIDEGIVELQLASDLNR